MGKRLVMLLMALLILYTVSAFATEEEPAELTNRKQNVVFLQIGNYATVSDGTLTWVDRDNKNVIPYIKDSRTMVPLRFLAEEMGATVGYDEQTRGITITLNGTVMELWADRADYFINGEARVMDCATEILEGRTFVPVRFVSESLGKAVEWLNEERIVVVTPADSPWQRENPAEKAVLAEVRLSLSPLGRDKIR
ncbi:MAG: copper amine oxidase N-terminal domain-containing protein [Clostridia bacterium]|nr:copper amine oxidase N-terminal domain-containing protein [Clostridia bacterium]